VEVVLPAQMISDLVRDVLAAGPRSVSQAPDVDVVVHV
jgi:hypothetical protein